MRPLIRHLLSIVVLSTSIFSANARPRMALPASELSFRTEDITRLDEILASSPIIQTTTHTVLSESASPVSGGHICSCQILDLSSANYNHQRVVVLAEKTYYGSSKDLSAARNRIQKEKKHLRKMFYDRITLLSEITGSGSCKSMFFRLKTADKTLRLYEILNADIY